MPLPRGIRLHLLKQKLTHIKLSLRVKGSLNCQCLETDVMASIYFYTLYLSLQVICGPPLSQ